MEFKMKEQYIEELINRIGKLVSEDVSWFDACTIYIEDNQIDAETFAEIVNQSPFLLSKIIESVRIARTVQFDYAALPI
jgi:hypothetical protein